MGPGLICSSHTISGVMPGSAVAARHGFEARVEACAAAGYTGMCLHIRDYAEQRAAGRSDADLRRVLADNGISHVGLEFLTGWDAEGAPAAQSHVLEETAWRAADALGALYLNVGAGLATDPAFAHARFAGLCARAAPHGLPVALEIVPWSAAHDLPSALAYIDGIANAGLVIDTWHVFRGGIALGSLAGLPGELILGIQINDAPAKPRAALPQDTLDRRLCGAGAFDLTGFLRAMARTGATCPVSVEVISPDLAALDVGTAARLSAEAARRVLAAV
jgi:sugar phosphate isomerase/epimerase